MDLENGLNIGTIPAISGEGGWPDKTWPRVQTFSANFPYRMWAEDVLSRYRSKTIPESSPLCVADIGCGNGAVSFPFVWYFSEMIPFVNFWLVDKDIRACEGIRSLMDDNVNRRDQHNKISYSFLSASVTDIPIEANSCQAIICRNLLHWLDIPDIIRALKEIYRILSPNGLAIVDTRTVYSPSNVCVDGVLNERLLVEVHEHVIRYPNEVMRRYVSYYQKNMCFFTEDSINRVLDEAGFVKVIVQTYRSRDLQNGLEDAYRPGIRAVIEKRVSS